MKSIPDWIVEGQRVQQQHLSLLKAQREQSQESTMFLFTLFCPVKVPAIDADNTVTLGMNPKKFCYLL